jgi:Fe-S-cluster containining protein
MDWENQQHQVQTAQHQFDGQIERCFRQLNEQQCTIHCHAGCANCCTLAVNCSFSEALHITKHLSSKLIKQLNKKILLLQEISRKARDLKDFLRLFRNHLGGCPFLDEKNCCAIYDVRPFSCRALLSTRPADWCGVDFATLHPLEKQAFLSSLNRAIVNFPTHYLAETQELAAAYEAEANMRLFDASGIFLSGNLIYLLWLEINYKLSSSIAKSPAFFLQQIDDNQLNLPYLLQIQTKTSTL